MAYWVEQGIGQVRVLFDTVSIEEALLKQELSEQQKINLRQISQIKDYAENELGLKKTSNYNEVYLQEGQPILWALSASHKFKLEPYKWNYLLLGELGYRGYFNKARGENERDELIEQGYDASLNEVSAWSTLGWFDDPILSQNLEMPEGEFARLIIHELTHTTLYYPNDDVFNENIATYVGNNGALQYLALRHGEGSPQYVKLKERLDDISTFENQMMNGTKLLDSLFSITELDTTALELSKQNIFNHVTQKLKSARLNQPERYTELLNTPEKWDNTLFTSFSQYYSQQDSMDRICKSKYGGSIREMISDFK